jgi:tryptophan halogenase
MQDRFYEILDFINMHYCLTRRTDTEFWREVRRPEMINDRLQAKFDYWKIKPPSVSDFIDQFFTGQAGIFPTSGESVGDGRCPIDTGGLWNHHSYEAILYGMDFLRDECNERYGENRPRPFIHKKVIDAVDSARDKLPPHDVWLRRMVGMPDYTKG